MSVVKRLKTSSTLVLLSRIVTESRTDVRSITECAKCTYLSELEILSGYSTTIIIGSKSQTQKGWEVLDQI